MSSDDWTAVRLELENGQFVGRPRVSGLEAFEDVSLNGNVKLHIEMSEVDRHGN